MNIYAPKTKDQWPGFEFKGKPWTAFGRTWMRASLRGWSRTYFYNFEQDMFYDKGAYDELKILKPL